MANLSTNIINNGETQTVTVEVEENLAKWFLKTQSEQAIHDFVLYEKEAQSVERRETRHTQSLDASMEHGHDFADESADVVETVMTAIRNQELYAAIAKLTPNQQWLIQEVFFNERKKVDIAAELGITEAAVRDRLKKIYAKLKKML